MPWSPWPSCSTGSAWRHTGWVLLAVSFAAALLVAVAVRLLAGAARLRPDLGLALLWCLGIGGGFLIAAFGYIRGVAVPDEFPQAPDVPYQANHVRWGIDTGNVNPFSFAEIGGLGDHLRGFYPSLWHGFTVPVAELTGASVPLAINAMDVAMLAAFTAGCVFLANQLITQRASVTLWSGVLSASFVAFPTFMFTWSGVLPNILAIALFPALLALVLEWLDQRASSRLDVRNGGHRSARQHERRSPSPARSPTRRPPAWRWRDQTARGSPC